MKRGAKVFLIVCGGVLLAIASIPLFVNANTFRPAIEKQLASTLGRNVKIGELRLSVFSRRLVSQNLSIAEDPSFGNAPFLTAKSLEIGISLRPLIFSHELRLRSFQIESPQINLIRAANGAWNFSSLGRPNGSGAESAAEGSAAPSSKGTLALPDVSIGSINIEDGRVTIAILPANEAPSVYQGVKVTAHETSLSSRFPFEMSANLPAGGSVNMKGAAGPIRRDDAGATPFDAQISVRRLDPIAAGFLDPQAGVAFVGDVEAHSVSNGEALTADGTAHLENLELRKGAKPAPKPVDFAFSVTHGLKSNSGEIQDASVKLGDTAVHASGTYQLATGGIDDSSMNLKLSGQNLPINELQNLMTAAAVRLPNGSALKGGTLGLNLGIRGQPKALVINGPIELNNARLVGFDIGSKIHGIAALSGMPAGDTTNFERLRMNVRMANSGMAAEHVDAVIGGVGTLTGRGTVSPSDQLDFNLVLTGASAKGIGKVGVGLISALSGGSGGKSGVPIHVAGTSEEPYITADVGSIFGGKKKSSSSKKN